ncbi:hypothetical protein Dimus_002423 [Dionaea muscipula]
MVGFAIPPFFAHNKQGIRRRPDYLVLSNLLIHQTNKQGLDDSCNCSASNVNWQDKANYSPPKPNPQLKLAKSPSLMTQLRYEHPPMAPYHAQEKEQASTLSPNYDTLTKNPTSP